MLGFDSNKQPAATPTTAIPKALKRTFEMLSQPALQARKAVLGGKGRKKRCETKPFESRDLLARRRLTFYAGNESPCHVRVVADNESDSPSSAWTDIDTDAQQHVRDGIGNPIVIGGDPEP